MCAHVLRMHGRTHDCDHMHCIWVYMLCATDLCMPAACVMACTPCMAVMAVADSTGADGASTSPPRLITTTPSVGTPTSPCLPQLIMRTVCKRHEQPAWVSHRDDREGTAAGPGYISYMTPAWSHAPHASMLSTQSAQAANGLPECHVHMETPAKWMD